MGSLRYQAFEIKQFSKDEEDEPEPKQIMEVIDRIAGAAEELISALSTLHSVAYRLSHPTALMRRGHLAWFNAFFAQAIAGHPSNDLENYGIADDFQKLALIQQLAHLQSAAMEAPKHFDVKLVARKPGQANPALRNFVRCAQIWRNMTGRTPSANKISTKRGEQVETETSDLVPDFVVFIRDLAGVGGLPAPTSKQVQTALKPITVENSSQ